MGKNCNEKKERKKERKEPMIVLWMLWTWSYKGIKKATNKR